MRLADVPGALFAVSVTVPTVWLVRVTTVDGEVFHGATLGVYAADVAAVVIVTAALVMARARVVGLLRRLWRSALGVVVSVAALTVYGALGALLWAPDAAVALWQTARVVLALGVGVALAALRVRARVLLWAFVAAMSAQSAVALWQFGAQEVAAQKWLGVAAHSAVPGYMGVIANDAGRFLRAYGFQSHPNIFGVLAAWGMLAAGVLAVHARRAHVRSAALALGALCAVGVAVSFSRAALATVVVGVVACAILVYRQKIIGANIRIMMRAWAMLGVALVIFLLVLAPVWGTRVAMQERLERQSLTTRAAQYAQAWTLLRTQSLVGVGAGNYTTALRTQDGAAHGVWWYQNVHNVPLLWLTEFGVLGALLLVPGLVCIFTHCARRRTALLILALPAPPLLLDHWLWSSAVGVHAVVLLGAVWVRGIVIDVDVKGGT